MSHTTTLDNGVTFTYDGGDLGGPVYIRFPDGRQVETRWDDIARIDQMTTALIRFGDISFARAYINALEVNNHWSDALKYLKGGVDNAPHPPAETMQNKAPPELS